MRVEAIYSSPVKSLGLQKHARTAVGKPGIPGDRAFYLTDDRARLFTQREFGALVQVRASYDAVADALALTFPDGRVVEEPIAAGQAVTTRFWGERPVEGHVLRGGWSHALSTFCGQDVHLVKADRAGGAFDGFPMSMCSTGSIAALSAAAQRDHVDHRRFRQNLLFSSDIAHIEDTWLDATVRAGTALLRVRMKDSRCVITTHDPDTGAHDMDTLKIIAGYRTDQPKEVNFGVYATVIEPGEIGVGDEVRMETTA